MKMRTIKGRLLSIAFTIIVVVIVLFGVAVGVIQNTKIGSKTYEGIMQEKLIESQINMPSGTVTEAYGLIYRYLANDEVLVRNECKTKLETLRQEYEDWISENSVKYDEDSDFYRQVFITSKTEGDAIFKIIFEDIIPLIENRNEEEKAVKKLNETAREITFKEDATPEDIEAAKLEAEEAQARFDSDTNGYNTMLKINRNAIESHYKKHMQALETATTFANEAIEAAEKRSTMVILIGIGVFALAAVVSTCVALLIQGTVTKSIINQINAENAVMKRIAEGELSLELPDDLRTHDEFGVLTDSIEKTLAQLKKYSFYIDDITKLLTQMAEGDMLISFDNEYTGEFANIKDAIQQITVSLGSMLKGIDDTADSVADGSSNVAGLAGSLADGARDQAATLEELEATVEEITATSSLNTQSALKASENSTAVMHSIEKCNAQMQALLLAMDSIIEQTNAIGNIAAAIEDIASQTNLLSLNAAIEAARAGDAGRGFGVVASEVGKLAADTVTAVSNTNDLVNKTKKAVEEGNLVVKQTASALNEVTEGAQSIMGLVEEIAKESEHQTDSLEEFSNGISSIAEIVDASSKAVERSADESVSLKEKAHHLRDLTSMFKV